MGADMQTIPARHGTATFVPAGSTIKIVNTSGTQVVDTWAFALPSPPTQKDGGKDEKALPNGKPEEATNKVEEVKEEAPKAATPLKKTKSKKGGMDLPSQEEAELATAQGANAANDASGAVQKKGWSSYIPSIPLRGAKTDAQKAQQKENSRTWSQYFTAGQGFTNYIPSKKSISSFTSSHYRDPNKPYIQQLTDFSRTPVGAAGISALSGQGYASSLYAGYSAWTSAGQEPPPGMEYLSMPHTRAATLHLQPEIGDVLVSNLREPLLTLVEDSSGGVHDTLIAACDPARYRGLGVDKWEEHGSCAENLVLALKELNERAGLKGPKGIGADVTVNSVPAPLNLFMNIPWTDDGSISFDKPKSKKGGFVRFKAERDVVVVMSACPQDVLDINAKSPQDGHFVVEEEVEEGDDVRKRLESVGQQQQKKPVPVKRASGTPKKLGTGGATARKTAPAAAASKPAAASGSHAPIGAVKKGKTPIGTKKAVKPTPATASSSRPAPSTSTTSNPASQAATRAASSTPTPRNPNPVSSAAASRRDSASTVPSNVKHGGPTSTIAGSSASTSVADSTGGAASSTGAGASGAGGAATAAVEKKKPRKIQRKVPAPA